MPLINIKITKDGVSSEKKEELIEGATQLMADVLGKNPATTFVIIDEVDDRAVAHALPPNAPGSYAREHFCLTHDLGLFTTSRQDSSQGVSDVPSEEFASMVFRVIHDPSVPRAHPVRGFFTGLAGPVCKHVQRLPRSR